MRVVLRPGTVTPADIAAVEGWQDVRVWKVGVCVGGCVGVPYWNIIVGRLYACARVVHWYTLSTLGSTGYNTTGDV